MMADLDVLGLLAKRENNFTVRPPDKSEEMAKKMSAVDG